MITQTGQEVMSRSFGADTRRTGIMNNIQYHEMLQYKTRSNGIRWDLVILLSV